MSSSERRMNAMSTASPDLVIHETRVYRGPNVWSFEPSIHLVVDLGSLEDYPTNTLPGFVDGLLDVLPGIARHSCSRGSPRRLPRTAEGGHLARSRRRARRPAAAAGGRPRHPAGQDPGYRPAGSVQRDLRLRRRAGRPGGRAPGRPPGQPPGAGRPGVRLRRRVRALPAHRRRTAFGPSTQAILDEAVSRDIPWLRLNEYSLVQLGQGVHQHRIRATMTSHTSALAVDIAGDKDLTTRLLAAAGLPVPRSESVRTVERAVRAANRIGYPGRLQAARRQPRARCRAQHHDADAVSAAFPIAEDQSRRGRSSSRASSPARTIGSSSSAAGWSRWPNESPHTSSVTAAAPSASSSTTPTPTRGAAWVTRRCSRASRSTMTPSPSYRNKVSAWTTCRPPAPWSS